MTLGFPRSRVQFHRFLTFESNLWAREAVAGWQSAKKIARLKAGYCGSVLERVYFREVLKDNRNTGFAAGAGLLTCLAAFTFAALRDLASVLVRTNTKRTLLEPFL